MAGAAARDHQPERHRQPDLVGDRVPGPSLRPADQRHARIGRRPSPPTICETYARRVLARDKLKIAVVGDIDAATLGPAARPRVRRAAGEGRAGAGADVRAAGPRPAHRGRSSTCRRRWCTFGGPGIARKDPDFMAAYIVNHILGGGSFSSRLYREVREKRGLAYGVYSLACCRLDTRALFLGGTATRADAHRRDARADRERDPPHGRGGPDRGGARQGQVLSQGLLRARASTPRPRSPASSCRSSSTISASTTSSGATA